MRIHLSPFLPNNEQKKILNSPIAKKLTNKNCTKFTDLLNKIYDRQDQKRSTINS